MTYKAADDLASVQKTVVIRPPCYQKLREVRFNGPKSALGAIGYNRDFRDQSIPQVEFMTAELQQSRIPFFIRAYPGNESDAEQYRDSLPTIFDMVHKGSWIIMDNGGAAGDILDSIVKSGNRYITRTMLNASDEKRVSKEGGQWDYVEDGVCCIRHTFDSSGRTTYLFWSYENWKRSRKTAERNVQRMIDAVRTYQDGKFRASDFVTVRKNVIADVQIKVGIQSRFDFDDPDEVEGLVREVMGPMAGIFKLESSEQLTPLEALQKYRARATVEHLIHSLKRVSGIKPLRVWNESSIRGSMMLALLSETAVAMARYEMQPRTKVVCGKEMDEGRPSTESMVWSLSHLTVTRIIGKTGRGRPVYSNWDAISMEVFGNIRDELMRKSTFSMQNIGRNLSCGLS